MNRLTSLKFEPRDYLCAEANSYCPGVDSRWIRVCCVAGHQNKARKSGNEYLSRHKRNKKEQWEFSVREEPTDTPFPCEKSSKIVTSLRQDLDWSSVCRTDHCSDWIDCRIRLKSMKKPWQLKTLRDGFWTRETSRQEDHSFREHIHDFRRSIFSSPKFALAQGWRSSFPRESHHIVSDAFSSISPTAINKIKANNYLFSSSSFD
jgi:hypothetical protein